MSVQELAPLPHKSTVAKMEASMALGSFAIGTGEFAIMGLMPDIASNLQLSEPQVGHAISAYALGVVVGAPTLAILGARLLRKHMLLLLMALYALGNLATAFAPRSAAWSLSASSVACPMVPISVLRRWLPRAWWRTTSGPGLWHG